MVLARALAYIDVHGGDGLTRVAAARGVERQLAASAAARHAARRVRPRLHARVRAQRDAHEERTYGVRGLDVAKALLEEGFHSPTVYFPLIVDEALMFEPTETESLQTLEALAEAIERIAQRAIDDPDSLHRAPQTTPVSRVDEARAARHLIPTEDAAQTLARHVARAPASHARRSQSVR